MIRMENSVQLLSAYMFSILYTSCFKLHPNIFRWRDYTEISCHEEFPKTVFCDPITKKTINTNIVKKVFYSIVSRLLKSVYEWERNVLYLTFSSWWTRYSVLFVVVRRIEDMELVINLTSYNQ